MSGRKKPASKASRAAAAKKEGSGGPRSVEVRGITFTLPDEVPFSAMMASRKLLNAATEQNAGAAEFALIDVAEAYVGNQINLLVNLGLPATEGADAIKELLDAIKEEYGVGEGESSASSGS